MTNNLVLPLLALVLAVLAAIFPLRREEQTAPVLRQRVREIRAGALVAAVAVILFAVAATLWPSVFDHGSAVALGIAAGAVVGACSSAARRSQPGFVLGLVVLGASALRLLPPAGIQEAQIGFVAGIFVAAFATGGLHAQGGGGFLAVLASIAIVSADFLGKLAVPGSDPAAATGSVLAIAFLVSALVAGVVGRFTDRRLVQDGIGFVLLLLVGYLACSKLLEGSSLAMLWAGGVVVGGIVHLILAGDDKPDSLRFVLSAVIWLAAATVAFGIDHEAYGMAVTLLGGVCTLALMGNLRGLASITVAAAILVYRLFRELYPDDARAPDIGQHYTMIGIAIGALLPLLPLEWARSRDVSGWKAVVSMAVWLLILIGLPIAGSVLLGSKGAIGMVVGLSFAPIIDGLRGMTDLAPAGIGLGMGALSVLSYGWLGDWTDLERGVKIHAVIVVGIISLVLGAALMGLSRSPSKETEK
ncbi:MAG TPA: hypothetical protein VMI31_07360 [Fimbriimonadaceae bacterium]|nr:hypothetical protein [Fimbriimonadaceae bacterium]